MYVIIIIHPDFACLQLISVYPHLLPSNSNFTRSVPALHEIADVNQLVKGDNSVLQDFKYFLRTYLEEIRGTKAAYGFKQVAPLSYCSWQVAAMSEYSWLKASCR